MKMQALFKHTSVPHRCSLRPLNFPAFSEKPILCKLGLRSRRSHEGSRVKEVEAARVELDVLFGSGGRTATWTWIKGEMSK